MCLGADLVSQQHAAIQVNGEPQKRAQEISAEVAVALTLSELHPEAGGAELPSSKLNASACVTNRFPLNDFNVGSRQNRR